jgi:alginate O-acetyltransferase complex protein AlgI
MLFNSLEFLVFFIVVSILYYTAPFKYRWSVLLVASCFFYMVFKPVYILILGFTIIVDYYIGIWLGVEKDEKKRKQIITLSILANLGVLVVFKYYNFFIDNINEVSTIFGRTFKMNYLGIILPIGLSFHTFQAMSYTIEVYRNKFPSEKHLGIYSLYVMFYPQLVAGPIERPQNVIPQLKKNIPLKYDNISAGVKLIILGLFKKVVVADRLSYFVNMTYDNPEQYAGFATWIGTFFFCFQIYCDFSGYSDIALGTAKTMGYDLMENFRNPYYSKSISEFWKRWHISLSTWFKDYLYIPLGGSRTTLILCFRNI